MAYSLCRTTAGQEPSGPNAHDVNAAAANPGLPQSANRIQAIPIVLNRYGFERSTISISKGSYVLDVVNRSGLQQLPLFLERMPGSSVAGQPAAAVFSDDSNHKGGRLLQVAKFEPGTYRLRAGGWVLTIHVQ